MLKNSKKEVYTYPEKNSRFSLCLYRKKDAIIPVGIPPIIGARAGLIKVDIYFVPAIIDPPNKKGLIYSIY
jgi:hypothetical protein